MRLLIIAKVSGCGGADVTFALTGLICPELIVEWMSVIESALSEAVRDGGAVDDLSVADELAAWRQRVVQLNCIVEELKLKESKAALGVLNNIKSKHLKRWKQVDTMLTEALNEAKDNLKYLTALEKCMQPLLSGSPSSIIDTLPSLMSMVFTLCTVAKLYSAPDRISALFLKIANMTILNCKRDLNGDVGVWHQDVAETLERIKTIGKVKSVFIGQLYMLRVRPQVDK